MCLFASAVFACPDTSSSSNINLFLRHLLQNMSSEYSSFPEMLKEPVAHLKSQEGQVVRVLLERNSTFCGVDNQFLKIESENNVSFYICIFACPATSRRVNPVRLFPGFAGKHPVNFFFLFLTYQENHQHEEIPRNLEVSK